MKCRTFASYALVSFTLVGVACGGDDSGNGDTDASPDAKPVTHHDSGVDATIPDASAPDAKPDATLNDSGPDANDASVADANDGATADGSDGAVADANDGATADASDGAIADASDGAIADASDGAITDASDAADANGPIACTPLPTVGNIYYSRQGVFPDGGPKTDGELWIVKGDGTSDAMIGTGEHPRLSPDGKHLLFFRDAVSYYAANIYVRDLPVDGGAAVDHLVFTNDDAIGGFDWRPDSVGIVFDYKNDIYAADFTGTTIINMQKVVTYLDTNGYTDYPVVNHVDGRIAWHNFYDGLGISAADGGNAAHVPNTFAGAKLPQGTGVLTAADMFPAWSSDGTLLAFLRIPPVNDYVPGTMGTPYKIQPDGGARTYLTPGLNPGDGFFGGGVISADGAYYINAGIYLGVQDMYAVPLDGSGAIKRVCTTPGAPIDFVGNAL